MPSYHVPRLPALFALLVLPSSLLLTPDVVEAQVPLPVAPPSSSASESGAPDPDDHLQPVEDDREFQPGVEDERSLQVTTTARAPMEVFDAARSVGVTDADDIAADQALSIAEATGHQPGLFRQATGRGADTLFIRGLVGPENLIYVDGVRFNQSTFRTGPNQYLATIDPWALGRIEIVRGPGSVLFGGGAMGGVIHLFPHDVPSDALYLRAIATHRTADNALGAGLDVGGRGERVAAVAGFSVRDHGQLRVGTRNSTAGSDAMFVAAERDGRMLASDYSELHYRGAVRTEIDARSSFRLNYLGGLIDGAPRTDGLGSGDIRRTDNRDDLVYATYTYERGHGPLAHLNINASFHRTHETVDAYRCRTNPGAPLTPGGPELPARVEDIEACARLERDELVRHRRDDDTVNTVGLSAVGVSYVPSLPMRLSWGGELYRDRVLSVRETAVGPDFEFQRAARGNFASGSHYTTAGAFVHGEYSLFSSGRHELVATGGGRLEHFRAFAPAVAETSGQADGDEAAALGDIAYANTGLVGTLGLSYLYGTSLNLYLNWSQGFRAPNLQETTVLGDTGNFFEIPNPELGPERNDTFELGTRLDLARWVYASGAVFASLLSDRIVREDALLQGEATVGGKQVQRRINAESAYFYGWELAVETRPLFGVHLFGNVAGIDGAVASDSPDDGFEPGALHDLFATADHYQNPRRLPPLQYLAGLGFTPDPSWSVSFYAAGAGARRKLAPGDLGDPRSCEVLPGTLYRDLGRACPGNPAFVTLNLRGTYHIENYARIDLALLNLTDERYRHHGSGPLAPGFQGMVTMTVFHP